MVSGISRYSLTLVKLYLNAPFIQTLVNVYYARAHCRHGRVYNLVNAIIIIVFYEFYRISI